ncbi:hypothetical protein BC940DRAFT_366860 [Gongronella butleri]|nr:hypothetical protein BC940DRAFT_366860 [Gongronella butleri]
MDADIVSVPRSLYQSWQRRLSDGPAPSRCQAFRPSSCTLPPELLFEVFSYLRSSPASLYAVSLVNYQWYLCATPILYRHVKLHNTFQWATFILTMGRKHSSFQYGPLVHSVDLSSSTSFFPLDQDEDPSPPSAVSTGLGIVRSNSAPPTQRAGIDPIMDDDELDDEEELAQGRQADHWQAAFRVLQRRLHDEHQQHLQHHQHRPPPNQQNGQSARQQQDQQATNGNNECIDLTFVTTPVVLSTSSLMQLAEACANLTALNLSHTHVMNDSKIVETGDYISTLQDYAIQQGFTIVKVSMENAIQAIGNHCPHVKQLKMQHCEWVTARIIWAWVNACPNLVFLDVRRSPKCTVKRLTSYAIRAIATSSPAEPSTPNPTSAQTIPAATDNDYQASSASSSSSTSSASASSSSSASVASSSTPAHARNTQNAFNLSQFIEQNLLDPHQVHEMLQNPLYRNTRMRDGQESQHVYDADVMRERGGLDEHMGLREFVARLQENRHPAASAVARRAIRLFRNINMPDPMAAQANNISSNNNNDNNDSNDDDHDDDGQWQAHLFDATRPLAHIDIGIHHHHTLAQDTAAAAATVGVAGAHHHGIDPAANATFMPGPNPSTRVDEYQLPDHITMKDYVLRVLKDGQEQGLVDLHWFQS